MKKTITIVVALGMILSINMAVAKANPNGGPFQALWGAIEDLQNQIDNFVALPGPAGPEGPQGEKGEDGADGADGEKGDPGEDGEDGADGADGTDASALHLFDANNQDLGILLDSEGIGKSFHTFLPALSARASFDYGQDIATFTPQRLNVFYEEAGCGGTMFLPFKLIPQRIYTNDNFSVFYLRPLGDIAQPRTSLSRINVSGGVMSCVNEISNWPETSELQIVTLPFSLPLQWPLEIR